MATVSSGILSAAALFFCVRILYGIIYIIRKNTCAFLLQMV